ncbi:Hypothetical_protein [Hexamita inflata]|uniref:Hypothetical_protein n=1 Tax=Hexamita inflata TaxID=28002 RepID=A0AA86RG10_9EUKA|nr:Hypothetical protein HINF_LOCUS61106 [Hexamita inflata]
MYQKSFLKQQYIAVLTGAKDNFHHVRVQCFNSKVSFQEQNKIVLHQAKHYIAKFSHRIVQLLEDAICLKRDYNHHQTTFFSYVIFQLTAVFPPEYSQQNHIASRIMNQMEDITSNFYFLDLNVDSYVRHHTCHIVFSALLHKTTYI